MNEAQKYAEVLRVSRPCESCGWREKHGRNPIRLRSVGDRPSRVLKMAKRGVELELLDEQAEQEEAICRRCWVARRKRRTLLRGYKP